ncbi:MAG: complex I NDUFA9 subunit family protein [Pseudomonadota bacterium]
MTTNLITVFGGSGFVGRNVVRELAKHGYRVRVAVRRPHLAHFLKPLGDVGQIQLQQTNARHRPSVDKAVEGASAVVNLVGILTQSGAQSFFAVHANGARLVAEAAAAADVGTFVQVSAIGADAASPSLYARSKAAGETAVRKAFPEAAVLRPSIVFGPEDDFFNRFAAMARFSPALPAIGGGKTRFQPVYVDDVADAVCAAIERPDAKGRTYELGGPKVYTFIELMKIMLEIIERKRFLAPVPFPIAKLIGIAGQIAGRLPFVDPILTEDQVKLLKRDNVVGQSGEDNIGTLADLGVAPQALEAILPTYLERYRKYGQFEPSRAS